MALLSNLNKASGQATVELTPFQKIIGVEPSSQMIEKAQTEAGLTAFPGQIEFKHSSAEELPFLEDGSVDLITSGPQKYYSSSLTDLV